MGVDAGGALLFARHARDGGIHRIFTLSHVDR